GASTAEDNAIVSGISGVGDYLVLGLGLVEVALFLLFVARHYKKIYVSLPAVVIVVCVSFGYYAYQDLMSSGNLMFESDLEQQVEQGSVSVESDDEKSFHSSVRDRDLNESTTDADATQ
ncbi:hypothetical protein ABMA58_15435, partial [Oceanospirillum sp. HFRX-1_2]